MAENSKIEWTTHTSLTWRPKLKSKLMNGNMARLAQGHTIPCFSAQFREFSKANSGFLGRNFQRTFGSLSHG